MKNKTTKTTKFGNTKITIVKKIERTRQIARRRSVREIRRTLIEFRCRSISSLVDEFNESYVLSSINADRLIFSYYDAFKRIIEFNVYQHTINVYDNLIRNDILYLINTLRKREIFRTIKLFTNFNNNFEYLLLNSKNTKILDISHSQRVPNRVFRRSFEITNIIYLTYSLPLQLLNSLIFKKFLKSLKYLTSLKKYKTQIISKSSLSHRFVEFRGIIDKQKESSRGINFLEKINMKWNHDEVEFTVFLNLDIRQQEMYALTQIKKLKIKKLIAFDVKIVKKYVEKYLDSVHLSLGLVLAKIRR